MRQFDAEFEAFCRGSLRLIATDMDGTLTCQGKFTAELLRALTTLEGIQIPVLITTGRSAGWVSGLAHYLPVVGAIAENGGVYCTPDGQTLPLVDLPDPAQHRRALADLFLQLGQIWADIKPSADNGFRLTDWTFDIGDLNEADLSKMGAVCRAKGWDFTYSSVQCHIKLLGQDKAQGLLRLLRLNPTYQAYRPDRILTVGDSPNDASLFAAGLFGSSVGVANVRTYEQALAHRPTYVTQQAEGEGFLELARAIQKAREVCHPEKSGDAVGKREFRSASQGNAIS